MYMRYKEFLGTIFFIITSLVVYALFPVTDSFQQVFIMLVFFVIFPLSFNKLFLKNKLSFYGLQIGDWKKGLIWSFYSLIIVFFVFFILIYFFGFLRNYSIPIFITKSFLNFIMYEFLLSALFVLIYEFYFRGFILFIFKTKLEFWAILVQALIFLILVLVIGYSSLFLFLPYLIFTPFAGFIALKSRSILYSGISQFLIILILDTLIVGIIS